MAREGRLSDEPRPVTVTRSYTGAAAGSVLYEAGRTRVLCAASVESGVPPWLEGRGRGWMTAEYRMLPSSTRPRKARDSSRGRVDGRNTEIQRLIGRSLRSVADLELIPDRTIWLDCDVLEADGGTRTAAISGAYIALVDALRGLEAAGELPRWPLRAAVAAISVGVVDGEALLDLEASEDRRADVDMNVVLTGDGRFVEIQGTAERDPFDDAMMGRLLGLARRGVERIVAAQETALGERGSS